MQAVVTRKFWAAPKRDFCLLNLDAFHYVSLLLPALSPAREETLQLAQLFVPFLAATSNTHSPTHTHIAIGYRLVGLLERM